MTSSRANQVASADLDVRRKAISIVLNMTTSRNVEEVVLFFKKQLQRTQEQDFDKVGGRTYMGCLSSPLVTT